jgi:hypothetical protein
MINHVLCGLQLYLHIATLLSLSSNCGSSLWKLLPVILQLWQLAVAVAVIRLYSSLEFVVKHNPVTQRHHGTVYRTALICQSACKPATAATAAASCRSVDRRQASGVF